MGISSTLSNSRKIQVFAAICLVAALEVLNFSLILTPAATITEGSRPIGPFRSADVIALMLTAVGAAMSLVFLEMMGITRVFKELARAPRGAKLALAAVSGGILVFLALIQPGILYMAGVVVQENAAAAAAAQAGPAELALAFFLPLSIVMAGVAIHMMLRRRNPDFRGG